MKIHSIKPEGKISICPICGYKDGFHVSLHVQDEVGKAGVVLICPSCHNHFQVGWTVQLSEK